jgi:hypothetical protein
MTFRGVGSGKAPARSRRSANSGCYSWYNYYFGTLTVLNPIVALTYPRSILGWPHTAKLAHLQRLAEIHPDLSTPVCSCSSHLPSTPFSTSGTCTFPIRNTRRQLPHLHQAINGHQLRHLDYLRRPELRSRISWLRVMRQEKVKRKRRTPRNEDIEPASTAD